MSCLDIKDLSCHFNIINDSPNTPTPKLILIIILSPRPFLNSVPIFPNHSFIAKTHPLVFVWKYQLDLDPLHQYEWYSILNE